MIVVAVMLLAIPGAAENFQDIKSAPMERQLAFLDLPSGMGNLDPIIVARFRSLLNQLHEKHPSENDHDIGDWTVRIQGAMEKSGIKESLLNIMEGVNSVNPRVGHRLPTYKDCTTAYASLRIRGKGHRDAVAFLPKFIEALQADGQIKK
jgi:hypothetical protein